MQAEGTNMNEAKESEATTLQALKSKEKIITSQEF
jgi:hypothetical protein